MAVREMRWWPNYFLQKGKNFDGFWQRYLSSKQRNILYVLGKGFDPRMNCGIALILKANSDCRLTCMVINFEEGKYSPSQAYMNKVNSNFNELKKLLGDQYDLIDEDIAMLDGKKRIGGRRAAELFADRKKLTPYTDIIVDISAMPRSIFFPLINQILIVLAYNDIREKKINLHVVVAEDFSQDIRTSAKELDENASYMFSFFADMELESHADSPIIWFPVLGEGKQIQISTIYKLLEPRIFNREIEVCPVLPFPSRNPKRVDNLIMEYHRFFVEHNIESRNVIFADEQNPFDVYHQIRNAGLHYDVALEPLGGCRKVVSATSSKLLSLGALMAAREGKMAVAFVGSQGYTLDKKEKEKESAIGDDCELFEIWINGEPYF